jgi:predicted nucleotidyltransferase/uncharacterized protein (UPF0332 family)
MVRKEPNKELGKELSKEVSKLNVERDIAMDFSMKVYRKFDKLIKSIVLFGSAAKNTSKSSSDIDIIIIIDDVSVKWDQETIAWYREELGKLISNNPYKKPLHINTVKLSSWWEDLMRGDPIVINILRYGDPLIDFGGFFIPLKVLLQEGKIKQTTEAIYNLIQRAPAHMARANTSLLTVIDGLYWAMVDSAHAAIISAKISPSSPEHITNILKEEFVDKGMLKGKYADYYRDIHALAKEITHGKITKVTGKLIDEQIEKTNEFIDQMARLIEKLNKD